MPSITDKIRLNRKQDRRARFTDEEVNEMRELYAKGWTQKVIAELYGTHQSTVSYIVSEKSHEHLAEYRKANPPKRRTTEEAKLYMRNLRKYKRNFIERRCGMMYIHDATEEAYKNGYEKGKKEGAREILSDLKKQIHDKATYPYGDGVYAFVNLKVFDAVLQSFLNKYSEGQK